MKSVNCTFPSGIRFTTGRSLAEAEFFVVEGVVIFPVVLALLVLELGWAVVRVRLGEETVTGLILLDAPA